MITHHIKKGFDVRIAGKAEAQLRAAPEPVVAAVQAAEFSGIKAKPCVKEGDKVLVGDPLFFDKKDPDLQFVSPVSGTVSKVLLGARRALQRIEVTPGSGDEFRKLDVPSDSADRAEIVKAIKNAGLWPLIQQRPIGKLADGERTPVAIFINGMDTEPLAADPSFAVQGMGGELRAGAALLRRLTDGKLYLSVRAGDGCQEFSQMEGVEVHGFAGPHPSGLVGTHIHEIAPLKPDQCAWTIRALDLAAIGRWVLSGQFPTHRVVAVAGDKAPERAYFKVRQGAHLSSLFGSSTPGDDTRVVLGTVLHGQSVDADGFLGYGTHTVTCMPSGGDQRDLFGWLLPQFGKHSASRSVWSWLMPKKEYSLDARMHGGHRAIVNMGQMENVMPLDIHPTFLMRAIMANDLEEALSLGLLEVTEEDMALCTFVDPCKQDVGAIIRKGLDLFEAEG